MNVWDQMEEGKYTHKIPYSDTTKDLYNQEQCMIEEIFKDDLFATYEVSDNPFREDAYSIAYQRGHSGGWHDVASNFSDLVPLIQKMAACQTSCPHIKGS